MRCRILFSFMLGLLLVALLWPLARTETPHVQAAASGPSAVHRSPVDLVLLPDEEYLVSVNQTSDSVSLVAVATGEVVAEVPCGAHPSAAALTPKGDRLLVTGTFAGDLRIYELGEQTLRQVANIDVGFHPRGVAVSPDGKHAYVARTSANDVAIVNLNTQQVVKHIPVGQWPRYLAVSPDGKRLAVGTSGNRTVSVVDLEKQELVFEERFDGINAGQMQISRDGQFVYFPNMLYRHNPISAANIRKGWVLGSRITRIRLDKPARRQAMTLDKQGEAVADPHGIALTRDEEWLVASASGSHEMLVYRLPGLPFQDVGGPGDHIDSRLLADKKRFYRFPLGGRPMALRMSRDDRHVYVANYLQDAIQVVDFREAKIVRTIHLGGPKTPGLIRRGEAIFYDGQRSLDQWYSCHSCHYEGGTNAQTMDTLNDGTIRTFKTVLPLYHLGETAPWTWHGWQRDLHAAMRKSMLDTMQGKSPSDGDVEALAAYLKSLQPPPNPYRPADGLLGESAKRGKSVFESAKAGCANCHSGPYFTDGKIHDVGTGSDKDRYDGYNTPTLIGAYAKTRYLHHGRAKSLESLLTEHHNPANVAGEGELTDRELRDLIAYLKSL